MKIQRVYVDTSVIGGCFDPEFELWSNGLFKDFALGIFKPVTSDLVAAEVADAPRIVIEKYEELFAFSPELLEVTGQAIELASIYQSRGILTPNFFNDGLHIALATIAQVDVMVSWNFKHIVHLNKIRLFNAVNLEQGYRAVEIYSPREVTTYEANGD
jgi:hypothetical protein